jgi:hypothetical protein
MAAIISIQDAGRRPSRAGAAKPADGQGAAILLFTGVWHEPKGGTGSPEPAGR